jgi:hypothetical protein
LESGLPVAVYATARSIRINAEKPKKRPAHLASILLLFLMASINTRKPDKMEYWVKISVKVIRDIQIWLGFSNKKRVAMTAYGLGVKDRHRP